MKSEKSNGRIAVTEASDVELPEGWTNAAMSSVTTPVQSVNPAETPNRVFSYVDISSICNSTFRILEKKTFSGEDAPSRARRPIQKGDVLYSNVRTYLRNIALVESSSESQLCSTGFTVLRSNGLVDERYLFRFVLTDHFLRQVSPQQTGTHYPATSDKVVFSETIPIPPLAEQRRIVEKVESILTRANASRERLGKVPAILKRFRQAVLAAACSGRLTADWREKNPNAEPAAELLQRIATERRTNAKFRLKHDAADNPSEIPDSWVWTTVETVAAVQGGIQKQPKRAPVKNHYPYLRVANVGRGKLDLDTILEIELFGNELETLRLERGDILIVEGNGSITEIGRSAIWNGAIKNCVHQNHIIRVRVFEIVPEFVNYYWNSPDGIQRVTSLAATTTGLYTLSVGKISSLPVPIPPLAEQHEIIRRVEKLFKLADAIEKRVTAGTARAEKLTQAILAKAFRGELVPTEAELARQEGRSYESAAELLKRVTASRVESLAKRNHETANHYEIR